MFRHLNSLLLEGTDSGGRDEKYKRCLDTGKVIALTVMDVCF